MALRGQLLAQLPFPIINFIGEPIFMVRVNNIPASGEDSQDKIRKFVINLDEKGAFNLMDGLLVAVDISSKADYIYGFTAEDGCEIKRAVDCKDLLEELNNLFDGTKLTVCIENCTGASALAEQLKRAGHNCVLMPTDYCVTFNQGNKDDANDAKAIYLSAVAARRYNRSHRTLLDRALKYEYNSWADRKMAALKSQSRLRSMVHNERTVLDKDERSLAAMLYSCLAQKSADLRKGIISCKEYTLFTFALLEEYKLCLTGSFDVMRAQMHIIDNLCDDPNFKRLMTIPAIGPDLAAAFCITANCIDRFSSARDFVAWLGIVPEHTGSGGKIKMGHMSKKATSRSRPCCTRRPQPISITTSVCSHTCLTG